jgi:hypothetical protein
MDSKKGKEVNKANYINKKYDTTILNKVIKKRWKKQESKKNNLPTVWVKLT